VSGEALVPAAPIDPDDPRHTLAATTTLRESFNACT
jgi:hypothetical protein